MTSGILHILNGDGTAGRFKNSGIQGESIIWREILSEGPVSTNEARLLDLRADYMHETYGVNSHEYRKNIQFTLGGLESAASFDEVVLWFEFDLLCQINLIYLLNWFLENNLSNLNISLVSIDSFPGITNFLGMGQLIPQQLASLFPLRKRIHYSDLIQAKEAWNAYASEDPRSLLHVFNQEQTNLHFLSKAIFAHLERFPSIENGLNRIESRILEIIEQKTRQRGEIFSEFWKTEAIYGMGDLQILNCIDSLLKSSMISGENELKLTELGSSVISKKMRLTDVCAFNRWNGGVHLKGVKDIWYWDRKNKELISR